VQATGAHFRIVKAESAPAASATDTASKILPDSLGPSTLRLDVDLLRLA